MQIGEMCKRSKVQISKEVIHRGKSIRAAIRKGQYNRGWYLDPRGPCPATAAGAGDHGSWTFHDLPNV